MSQNNFLASLALTTPPSAHVVLGSGFGAALEQILSEASFGAWKKTCECGFEKIQGLRRSTVEGHSGKFVVLKNAKGHHVLLQVGRLHGYEGYTPRDVVAPLMISRAAGTPKFILTNSSGSLDPLFSPGDVMIIEDHVNLTGQNPLAGENPVNPVTGAPFGPRFPDLGKLYDKEFNHSLRESCKKQGLTTRKGVYLGVPGPSFETPAEVRLFSSWGMSAVGMSTVWEAIALAHSGATVGALALISNAGCGLKGPNKPLDHHEILLTSKAAAVKILSAVLDTLGHA